jgi:hypothetical protein
VPSLLACRIPASIRRATSTGNGTIRRSYEARALGSGWLNLR